MSSSPYSVAALTRRRPLTPVHSWQTTTDSTLSVADHESTEEKSHQLQRSLGLLDIIFYGVGCSVGAGIYSLVGIGANLAGPSIALSFFLCGVACCFTSLSYAEFAARVPLAGSAYTFTYVSFGELCGWLVGWNLTLGYAVSAAVVARSWAEYLHGFLHGLAAMIFQQHDTSVSWWTHLPLPFFGPNYTCCPLSMVIVGLCTVVLVTGAKESTRFNTAMTLLNLSVLGFVLLAGITSGTVHSDNLTPVFPHGIIGMARGAGLVFFSYLGFDMVSCLSEEVKNPERNMPIGIISSLLVSMTIYVSVSIVVVGMAPVALLGENVPIVNALLANACCTHSDQLQLGEQSCLDYSCDPILHRLLYTGSRFVSFGAIFGLTTATFACLMGQPRIFYSMAQDGLLFKIYARVHPKTGVPTVGTILTGIFTALVACFVDLESLANAISLGTLQVFTFVNAGVVILRMQPSEQELAGALNENETQSLLDSPLHRHHDGSVARSLGLVQQTSTQIGQSMRRIRASSSSSLEATRGIYDSKGKPHILVLLFIGSILLLSMAFSHELLLWSTNKSWLDGVLTFVLVLVAFYSVVKLLVMPTLPPPQTFACPMVPTVPLLGIVCNTYMMGSMSLATWSAIMLWLLAGLTFYFCYGIHYSELRTNGNDLQDTMTAELSVVHTSSPLMAGPFDTSKTEGRGYNTM